MAFKSFVRKAMSFANVGSLSCKSASLTDYITKHRGPSKGTGKATIALWVLGSVVNGGRGIGCPSFLSGIFSTLSTRVGVER